MKTMLVRVFCLLLCLCILGGLATTAFAASSGDAVIDRSKTGSVTIYKIDATGAREDGALSESFVSSGVYDEDVYNTLINNGKTNTQGNGTEAHGYAIPGVVFSYLKIADITTVTYNGTVEVLYGIAPNDGLLTILGLTEADKHTASRDTVWYFGAVEITNAMNQRLADAPNATKSALEDYIAEKGTAMPETNEYGKSSVDGLELGVYLFVETTVSERVMTSAPFLLSVPMTASDNSGWLYDITVFPKNETDVPTLEKEVVERTGETVNVDGFAHTATASDSDLLDYRITSKLPSISSKATHLRKYTFVDSLSKGLTYTTGDVVVTWYKDAECTKEIAVWTELDRKFEVSYSEPDENGSKMTIRMTSDGLAEINNSTAVWGSSSSHSGYSDCFVRITYTAKVNSDATVVYGDSGNPNDVELVWKRSASSHYDQLQDDCHVYVYGIELIKTFADNEGNFSQVEFKLQNETDGYWVVAAKDEESGIYYVTGFVATQEEATGFVPTPNPEDKTGAVVLKGLENDTYKLYETRTDPDYERMTKPVALVITTVEGEVGCEVYEADRNGEVQHYEAHKLLTASATVNEEEWTMKEDNGSLNAIVPIKVVNKPKFGLPQTGETSAMTLPIIGGTIIALCLCGAAVLLFRKKETPNP